MEAWLQDLLGITSDRVVGAIIQGLLSFAGVLLTGLIAIWTWSKNQSSERRKREALRAEKQRDLQMALWSEIDALWTHLFQIGDHDFRLQFVRATFEDYRQRGKNYTPFVTSASGYFLIDRLAEDLVLLEQDEIRRVVRFYRQIKLIDELNADLKTDKFAALELDRKEQIILDLERTYHRATIMAEKALHELERALEIPVEERLEARKAKLSEKQLNKMALDQTPPAPEAGPESASDAGSPDANGSSS